jgi:hypothetical protein
MNQKAISVGITLQIVMIAFVLKLWFTGILRVVRELKIQLMLGTRLAASGEFLCSSFLV